MYTKRRWPSDRKLIIDVLSALFGLGSWLCVNGIFTQLPLLVQTAPEGWALPSFLSVIIQIANIGPIVYGFIQSFCFKDSVIICSILILCSTSIGLMSFFYTKTYVVFNSKHSIVLFLLTFCFALTSCTSSILFIPFMGRFQEVYLISYMVGEGLSGFLPSIVALVQGIGGNPLCVNTTLPTGEIVLMPEAPMPRFSTKVFFLFLFVLMCFSTVAFLFLNRISDRRKKSMSASRESDKSAKLETIEEVSNEVYSDDPHSPRLSCQSTASALSPAIYAFLLILQTFIAAMAHGALPSIQSYSCLPYGSVAYHLAVNLANMANPAACFLAFFLPLSSITSLVILCLLIILAAGYVFTMALLSPTPLLQHSYIGIAFIVICWTICSGLVAYVKMSIAGLFRREGGRGLFWYGSVTQVGSFLGASVMFVLVNHTSLFTQYDSCS